MSSRSRARTETSASSPRASSSCPARRSKTSTRPAPRRPPSRAMQGGRRPPGARLPRPWHVARQDPRRAADHAQGPLRDHAQLHAQGRSLGLDMMLRTCTIQVNFDYSSEADMVKKFRVGLALQPVATALFANSPFTEGKPNGFKSFRSHIWEDTDPDRTGMLPFVFEDGSATNAIATTCSMCRCISSTATANISMSPAKASANSSTASCRSCPARSRGDRLDRPSLDGLPRSAAEELPRNAWRRRRALGPDLRASGFVGRPALRRQALERRGTWSSIGRSRSARSCGTMCRGGARRRRRTASRCAILPAEVLEIAAGPHPPRQTQQRRRQ